MIEVYSRPPSANWESVLLPLTPPLPAFVWWKPAYRPSDLVFLLPLQTWMMRAAELSPRRIVWGLGLLPAQLAGWTASGQSPIVVPESHPFWDVAIPLIPTGDLTIHFHLALAPAAMVPAAPSPPPVTVREARPEKSDHSTATLVAAIEADWRAMQQLATQLDASRKQLGALQGKLQSLNRDLTADETRFADSQDKRVWSETRRWLRDAAQTVSRYIKEADIGVTSGAGKQNYFEELYMQVVEQGQRKSELATIRAEFESHRKTVQSILSQMQATLSNASRDGEQRAQQVLSRIAAKVRQGRNKH